MASSSAVLGVVGAVVLLVGIVLAGSGLVMTALAEQTEINCDFGLNNNCQQTERTAENTTIAAEFIMAAGAIVSGVGIFLVAFVIITIMARREAVSSPPSPPPAIWSGPVQFPAPGAWPPPPPPPPPRP
jgi:uncharacterized membrane protein